jgi:hypothetical protein
MRAFTPHMRFDPMGGARSMAGYGTMPAMAMGGAATMDATALYQQQLAQQCALLLLRFVSRGCRIVVVGHLSSSISSF